MAWLPSVAVAGGLGALLVAILFGLNLLDDPGDAVMDFWQGKTYAVYTPEELSAYQGTSKKILLAILGEVYDVSKGKKFYAKGGGYDFFAGIDASRAYYTGEFNKEGLTDDLEGLNLEQIYTIEDWRRFFNASKKYKYKGILVGRFYDKEGNPTAELIRVQNGIRSYDSFKALSVAEDLRFPVCNSNFSETEGGHVWCGYHLLPRKEILITPDGFEQESCRCFTDEQLKVDSLDGPKGILRVYENCPPESRFCRSSPPADPSPVDDPGSQDQLGNNF